MIAALPMYDRPETAEANNRLWEAVRDPLGYGPDRLTRGHDLWDIWQSPDLVLAQTCGLPYRSRLHGRVKLVGTPDYRLYGCPPGYYNSVIVAHRSRAGEPLSNLDGAGMAFNDPLSQSGWAAPYQHFAENGLRIGELRESGSHVESGRSVADGFSDFAALDALSWEMIRRYEDFAADLIEVDRTAPTPALPFITAHKRDPMPLANAFSRAIFDLSPADRDVLFLQDILDIRQTAYLAIPIPPAP